MENIFTDYLGCKFKILYTHPDFEYNSVLVIEMLEDTDYNKKGQIEEASGGFIVGRLCSNLAIPYSVDPDGYIKWRNEFMEKSAQFHKMVDSLPKPY